MSGRLFAAARQQQALRGLQGSGLSDRRGSHCLPWRHRDGDRPYPRPQGHAGGLCRSGWPCGARPSSAGPRRQPQRLPCGSARAARRPDSEPGPSEPYPRGDSPHRGAGGPGAPRPDRARPRTADKPRPTDPGGGQGSKSWREPSGPRGSRVLNLSAGRRPQPHGLDMGHWQRQGLGVPGWP